MQTLVEVGRQEYDIIEHYFKQICDCTSNLATQDEDAVGAQAIEFWTSLAEEELYRMNKRLSLKNYIPQCGNDLLQMLITCIQKVNI